MLYGLFYCCGSMTEAAVDSEVYCLTCRQVMTKTGEIESNEEEHRSKA